mgnify:CR=1 FL=1
MTISNRIILALSLTAATNSNVALSTSVPTLNINNLFDNLKGYKKLTGGWHAGHLYEHMVWVAKAMQDMFDKKSPWLEEIADNPGIRKIMIIAAFMHDIGKAGDNKRLYNIKPNHPRVGFEYLLSRRPFYIDDQKTTTYDFNTWASTLKLTPQERATIAVLTGMHQEFAYVLTNLKKGRMTTTLFEEYLEKLTGYVQEAFYNNGMVDEQIVRMSLALFRADFEGMRRVDCTLHDVANIPNETESLACVSIPNGDTIDTAGYTLAQTLIEYFKATRKIAHAKKEKTTLIV